MVYDTWETNHLSSYTGNFQTDFSKNVLFIYRCWWRFTHIVTDMGLSILLSPIFHSTFTIYSLYLIVSITWFISINSPMKTIAPLSLTNLFFLWMTRTKKNLFSMNTSKTSTKFNVSSLHLKVFYFKPRDVSLENLTSLCHIMFVVKWKIQANPSFLVQRVVSNVLYLGF